MYKFKFFFFKNQLNLEPEMALTKGTLLNG